MFSDPVALRVIAARFISRTGGEAAFFVGIWGKAAYEFEATPGGLAILMAALGLTSLAGAALAGMMIDRHGPKRVLLASEVLFVPVTIGAALTNDLTQLTIAAALIGLVSAPTFTAIASFPPYLTRDEERLARINAGVETGGMAALISGTAAGALLATLVSLDSIFFFDAATSLVAVAVIARVPTRHASESKEERQGGFTEIRQGIGFVYVHRRLRFYVLIGTSVWLLFGLFSALEPLFYRDVLERGPEVIGWVNTIFGVGLVAGTVLAAKLPPSLRGARAIVVLVALNGGGSLLYVGTRNLAVVVAGGVVWGVVIGLFAPLVRTMIHLNSPEDLVGRVMGTTAMHSEVAKLLPLLAAPGLAAAFGVQPTLALSGLGLTLVGLAAWRVAADLDRTREKPVGEMERASVNDEPLSPMP